MRAPIALFLTLLALVTTQACSDSVSNQEASRTAMVAALDTLVAELIADRPADAAAYTERLRAYLEAHPAFFGSAVALLDRSGTVVTSPSVYRTADGYATTNLAVPSYNIEAQGWFTVPLAANAGIWTDPYFDAGGGEIWMITRSVPVREPRAFSPSSQPICPWKPPPGSTSCSGGTWAIRPEGTETLVESAVGAQ